MKTFYHRLRWLADVCLILLLAGCGGVPSPEPYLAADRNERWLNDIAYLETTLPEVHKNLFFQMSEQEFGRRLEELKEKVPAYTDQQIAIELSLIVAAIGDTHTGASIGSERQYPLQLRWFEEGIYIMDTSKEYQELLGARILTLNGKKIEEAAETLKPMLGEANESWFKTQIIYYLPLPDVLQYFGLSDSEEIDLRVELAGGQEKTVRMKPVSYKEFVAAERPAGPVPLYETHEGENYWYEYLPDEKVFYLNYRSCQQMREKPFEIFAKEVWDFVQNREIEKFVLDLRENRGGSSTILNPFIKELKKSSFNAQGKLYVVIGRDTFSSAILNALSLQKETEAYFVGEPTGGKPNHYGEVKQFQLPNSEITIRYSTKYFKWLDDDPAALEPDKRIGRTYAAYRQGIDPVMDWIAAQK